MSPGDAGTLNGARDLKLKECLSHSVTVGQRVGRRRSSRSRKQPSLRPRPHPAPPPRGHPLVGGAEDEESTGFWNGHRLLLQLQLSQRSGPGAYWDLGLVLLIIPCGEGREAGCLSMPHYSLGSCALNPTVNPQQPGSDTRRGGPAGSIRAPPFPTARWPESCRPQDLPEVGPGARSQSLAAAALVSGLDVPPWGGSQAGGARGPALQATTVLGPALPLTCLPGRLPPRATEGRSPVEINGL